MLGEDAEAERVAKARKWILLHGGVTTLPTWGKLYLSVVGLYEWSGCNPVPPEFVLLPSFLPFSPGKLWCYLRKVYIPVPYLYGKKFVGPITSLIKSLRTELYIQPYETIDWNKSRHSYLKKDVYECKYRIQKVVWDGLYYVCVPLLTRWPLSKLRERAMKKAMDRIRYEDLHTTYLTHACLEKFWHMFAHWADDPNNDAFKFHFARVPDYLWVAEDGMKVQNLGSHFGMLLLQLKLYLPPISLMNIIRLSPKLTISSNFHRLEKTHQETLRVCIVTFVKEHGPCPKETKAGKSLTALLKLLRFYSCYQKHHQRLLVKKSIPHSYTMLWIFPFPYRAKMEVFLLWSLHQHINI